MIERLYWYVHFVRMNIYVVDILSLYPVLLRLKSHQIPPIRLQSGTLEKITIIQSVQILLLSRIHRGCLRDVGIMVVELVPLRLTTGNSAICIFKLPYLGFAINIMARVEKIKRGGRRRTYGRKITSVVLPVQFQATPSANFGNAAGTPRSRGQSIWQPLPVIKEGGAS